MMPQEATHKLFQAARSGNASDVKTALDAGADPNARLAYCRETPLHWAARNGHTDLARLLIEKGALVNARDNCQQTPLHFVARNGHTHLASLLIEKGADPNARDNWKQTPVHWAAMNGHTGVVKLFQDARQGPGRPGEPQRGA